jgi:ELWxxDGT repeat protein
VANIATPATQGSFPNSLTPFGNFLYFSATDTSVGVELWRTNGNPGGTSIVRDINLDPGEGSSPSQFFPFGDFLYFSADDSETGEELWRTDGTTASEFADILPGSDGSSPSSFARLGDSVYFSADDGVHGGELMRLGEPTPTPPPPPPPAADTTAPKLGLNAKKSAKLGKAVVITASCDEACTANATGKIAVKAPHGSKKAKSIKLKGASANLAAAGAAKLSLKLSKKSLPKAEAALRGGAKLKAKVSVVVTDGAGNAATGSVQVKLK